MTAGLYDVNGQRRHLLPNERVAFLRTVDEAERGIRNFCHTLADTGCWISEALALTSDSVDLKGSVIGFESFKKRPRGIYRAVPVPPAALDLLNMVLNLEAVQERQDRGKSNYLWRFARNTAWRHVCAVMKTAKISAPHATRKGLRHGFGIEGVTSGVPLSALQKRLGHAQFSTTSIHAAAIGLEAKQRAERMWR